MELACALIGVNMESMSVFCTAIVRTPQEDRGFGGLKPSPRMGMIVDRVGKGHFVLLDLRPTCMQGWA